MAQALDGFTSLPPLVAVVILSWNRVADVLRCLQCVFAQDHARTMVIVVDNASADDSVATIVSRFPAVHLIESATNSGYAGGVNLGLAAADAAGATYAWLLNDDVVVVPTTLSRMVDRAEARSNVGLFSPVVALDEEFRDLQFAGAWIDWKALQLRDSRLLEVGAPWYADRTRDTVVTGAALLLRMDVYRAIGSFDERFFAYYEDTDYSIRASRSGFSNALLTDVFVKHCTFRERAGRPPHFFYFMIRNQLLFFRLHRRGRIGVGGYRKWLLDALGWLAACRDRGQAAQVDAGVDGIWDALKGRYGPRRAPGAPAWFRRLVASHPYLLLHVLRGEFAALVKRITRPSAEERN